VFDHTPGVVPWGPTRGQTGAPRMRTRGLCRSVFAASWCESVDYEDKTMLMTPMPNDVRRVLTA
jgi:hypothetical protein